MVDVACLFQQFLLPSEVVDHLQSEARPPVVRIADNVLDDVALADGTGPPAEAIVLAYPLDMAYRPDTDGELADEFPVGEKKRESLLHAVLQSVVASKHPLGPFHPVLEVHETGNRPHVGREQPRLVGQVVLEPDLAELLGKRLELRVVPVCMFHAVAQRVADVEVVRYPRVLESARKVMGAVRYSVLGRMSNAPADAAQFIIHVTTLEAFSHLHAEHNDVPVTQRTVCLVRIEAERQEKLLLVDHDALVYNHTILARQWCVLLINGEAELENPVANGVVAWSLAERLAKDILENPEDGDNGPEATPCPHIYQDTQHDQLNRESMSGNRVERNLRCSLNIVIFGTSFFEVLLQPPDFCLAGFYLGLELGVLFSEPFPVYRVGTPKPHLYSPIDVFYLLNTGYI